MQYVQGYLILTKESLNIDCTNINILASFFFTPLCYFEKKQIPHSLIVFGMSLIQIGTYLALILHAKLIS